MGNNVLCKPGRETEGGEDDFKVRDDTGEGVMKGGGMKDKEWLQRLKEGDEVFVSQRFGPHTPARVARTTKTQIIIERKNLMGTVTEDRYRRVDGWYITSDRWASTYLIPPTDELRLKFKICHLRAKANNLREKMVLPNTEAELLDLIEVLSKYVPKKEG